MLIRKTGVASAVAGALLAPLASPTHAQQAAADAALDEIIVTARRREENLQTVPLAITAFSGESLEARGVDMVGNMNAMAPNLSVQGQAGRTNRVRSFIPRARGARCRRVRRRHRPDELDRSLHDGCRRGRPHRSAARPARHVVRQLGPGRRRPLRDATTRRRVRCARQRAQRHARPARHSGQRRRAARREVPHEIHVRRHEHRRVHAERRQRLQVRRHQRPVLSRRPSVSPTDNLDIRYSYDRSEQDRKGGSRAVWEIGPKNIFTLPNGVVFNTNPHAQAYENAFGILFDDHNVSSGHPGGIVGEYETRVADDTNGLQLTLDRQTLDVTWDMTDALTFRALAGDRLQTRRVMVQFDADSRVFLSDRQDNDEIDEQSYELQMLGSHGEREQFSWVFGYYASDRTTKARFPTFHGVPFICDLLGQPAGPGQAPTVADRRGVTIADRAECFNNRMRAINQQANFVATPQMTAAQIQAMWDGIVQNPAANTLYNYNGVTPGILAGLAGPNFDALDITDFETEALFADFSWAITERAHARRRRPPAGGHELRHRAGSRHELHGVLAVGRRPGRLPRSVRLHGSQYETAASRVRGHDGARVAPVPVDRRPHDVHHGVERLCAGRSQPGTDQHPRARRERRRDAAACCATSTTRIRRSSICRTAWSAARRPSTTTRSV